MVGRDCIDAMLRDITEYAAAVGAKRVVLWGHNAKNYDSFVLLQATEFPVKSILKTSQGILSLKLDLTSKISLEIRCSLVHVGASLKDGCEAFGVPEKFWKKDFDVTQITADNYRTLEVDGISLATYQEFDIWSLAYLFRNLSLAYEEIWGAQYTTKGLSFVYPFLTGVSASRKLFERRYKTCVVEVPRMHTLRGAIRMAMRGGMVQAFWREYRVDDYDSILRAGKQQRAGWYHDLIKRKIGIFPYDINSLYPYILQFPMPVGGLTHYSADLVDMIIGEARATDYDFTRMEFGFVKTKVLAHCHVPVAIVSYRGSGAGQLRYMRMATDEIYLNCEALEVAPEQFCSYRG